MTDDIERERQQRLIAMLENRTSVDDRSRGAHRQCACSGGRDSSHDTLDPKEEIHKEVLASYLESLWLEVQEGPRPLSSSKAVTMRRALNLVKRHPKLLTQEVGDIHPICVLIKSGATLQDIQEIYRLNPDVFQDPRAIDDCCGPLHVACLWASNEVIRFLAMKCTTLLSVQDCEGDLPLHIALGSRNPNGISLETIRLLAELSPEALKAKDKAGNTPLALAVANDCPLDVLEYLVSVFPEDHDTLEVQRDYYARHDTVLDLERTRALSKVFPRLKALTLRVSNWTKDGFICFLKQMQTNRSIANIEDLSMPTEISTDVNVQLELRKLVETNSALINFTLSRRHQHNAASGTLRDYDDQLLVSLQSGLQFNQTMQGLELKNLRLSKLSCLNKFLLSKSARRNQFFSGLQIRQADKVNLHGFDRAHSKVVSMGFVNCVMDLPTMQSLLFQVSKLPLLQSLSILGDRSNLSPVMITTSLVNLIKYASSLEVLEVWWYVFEYEPVCAALTHNKKLKRFGWTFKDPLVDGAALLFLDLLKNHNVTLTGLHLKLEENPEIKYYLELNRLGRAEGRDPQTTLPAFVNMLAEVIGNGRNDLLFGLLQESPSLWCSNLLFDSGDASGTNGKKRKRPPTQETVGPPLKI
jgi:hypothetical protein